MWQSKTQSGFTLLEIILVLGLVAIFLVVILSITWNVLSLQYRAERAHVVAEELQFVSLRLASLVRNAGQITRVESDRLELELPNGHDTVAVYLRDGSLYTDDGVREELLTSSNTIVTQLSFEDYRPDDGSSQSIGYEIILKAKEDTDASGSIFHSERKMRGTANVRNFPVN